MYVGTAPERSVKKAKLDTWKESEALIQSHWRIWRIHRRVLIGEIQKKRSVWLYVIICVYMTVFQLSLPFSYNVPQGFVTENYQGKITWACKKMHMFREEEFSAFALINQSQERFQSVSSRWARQKGITTNKTWKRKQALRVTFMGSN